MKHLIQISLVLWLVSVAVTQAQPAQPAAKTLRTFDWEDVKRQPPPPGSEIFLTNGIPVLKIENTSSVPLEITLLTITNSSLIAKANSFLCEMKYENVRNVLIQHTNVYGTLEKNIIYGVWRLFVWQHLPPEVPGGDEITNTQGFYFSGSENWKPYGIPVVRPLGLDLPTQLELKLSLSGMGTVYLRPIKLLERTHGPTGWWSPQQSGLIGGIGGCFIGCLGGLIGLLVSKGKARNFVLAAVKVCIVLGILLTIAGLVAAVLQQTYDVWYALLLPGVILVLVFSLNLHSIQRRYDELEIRRMTSIDTTGS